jgi:hypothetical protein
MIGGPPVSFAPGFAPQPMFIQPGGFAPVQPGFAPGTMPYAAPQGRAVAAMPPSPPQYPGPAAPRPVARAKVDEQPPARPAPVSLPSPEQLGVNQRPTVSLPSPEQLGVNRR